jgi:predicted TIM-barrel fold metal-dependent hydrolase
MLARRPNVVGPIIDMDQHFNEVDATWAETPLAAGRRLNLRDDADGQRHLYFGDRRIGPGRATRADEYSRIARLAESDPAAYERELAAQRDVGRRYHEVVDPSISDAVKRAASLGDMGADVAIQFPSYGFYWPEIVETLDVTAVHPHMKAWNRWIARACLDTAGQVLGVGQTGWYDVADAVDEVHRCAEDGLCGVVVGMRPFRQLPWSDPSNEPIWQALEDTGLVLFLHTSLMSHSLHPAWELAEHPDHVGPDFVTMVNRSAPVEAVLTDLLFAGVFERHPELRVAVVECGTQWVESYLHRIDWAADFLGPRNRYLKQHLKARPSEYIKRQVRLAAFPFEPLSRFFVEQAPEMLMYSSDFPHDEGTRVGIDLFERLFDDAAADVCFRQNFYVDNASSLLKRRRSLGVRRAGS